VLWDVCGLFVLCSHLFRVVRWVSCCTWLVAHWAVWASLCSISVSGVRLLGRVVSWVLSVWWSTVVVWSSGIVLVQRNLVTGLLWLILYTRLLLTLSVGLLGVFCVVSGILILLSSQISLLRSAVALVGCRVVVSHVVLKVSVLRGVRHAVTTVGHVPGVWSSGCGYVVTVQSSDGRRVGIV